MNPKTRVSMAAQASCQEAAVKACASHPHDALGGKAAAEKTIELIMKDPFDREAIHAGFLAWKDEDGR